MRMRRAKGRGHANQGWLNSYHTFSFADYYDPEWVGHRSLRVINDDLVMPGMGFGKGSHRNMEIITYVLSGLWSTPTPWARAGLLGLEKCSTWRLRVAEGAILVDGEKLEAGDAAALSSAAEIQLTGVAPAQVLLFDLN
jgi:redox-sensitive bicupin YhaK (pirin superfamily)